MIEKPIYRLALLATFLLSGIYGLKAQIVISGQIDWKSAIKDKDGHSYPSFENASYNAQNPFIPKACGASSLNEDPSAKYVASFTNISYKPLTAEEREGLKDMKLPGIPVIDVYVGESRQGNTISTCFYPFVNQNGVLKKVESYAISVSSNGQASTASAMIRSKKSGTAASSVLNNDKWFKISVEKSSLYKITPSFLSENGISSAPVSINKIRVVGNAIGMLPEENSEPRPDDLNEVPLQVFDQNGDGIFNGSDYAVFFAGGPNEWNYNSSDGRFTHTINIYRNHNYYFLTVENGFGTQVPVATPITGAATEQVNSFDDYDFREDEKVNLVGTGRVWFGDVFDFTLNYGYTFNFPNLKVSEPVRLRVNAVARASSGNTFMKTSIGNTPVLVNNFDQYGVSPISPYVTRSDSTTFFTAPGSGFTVNLNYVNQSNPSAVAWLDYIEVQARRNLTYVNNDMLYFRDASAVGAGQVAEFHIGSAPQDLVVWDVTDPGMVQSIPVDFSNNVISFKDNADELKQYVAFSSTAISNIPQPGFVGKVASQNLHGMPVAEMIIVTHPKFLAAAERLADFHRKHDNISVNVATTEEVYNEFSSGGKDISAIRDFAKLNYEKAQNEGKPFNYLLLFGDASYDYKDRITNNSDYVPVWESPESLNLEVSRITDDFYAYLDPSEGGGGFFGQTMDVGVGRIPSASVSEAESYVDKVIRYSSGDKRFGDWRNKILLMADDVGDTWETTFVKSSEILDKKITSASKSFNVDKIYTDAYRQVSTTGSQTYPEASGDMFRKVQQGNLITNYIGHGGEIGLSSEKLLQLADVNNWSNRDAMPLFITITCEFSRLDDPKRVSAGEQLALNPKGGAIALMSTTRVVNAGTAVALNEAVFNTIFLRPNNNPQKLGEIVRDAKNNRNTDATRLKFSLIGDPAIQLAIPYYRIQTNTVNGKPVAQGGLDTLKALTKVEVTGQVNDFNNQKINNFNGVADISVYDKASQKQTLVNDGIGSPIPFKLRNNLLYRGKVEVKNGDFSFEFLVPKDISYQFGFGKFSLYASDLTNDVDAAGYNDSIVVGGFNENAPVDNQGPTVQLYINDESFVRGGITDQNPELYAILADSSGINTVGNGIGHDLVAILDNKDELSYVINEYYEADLNSYQKGSVRYPFYKLAEGEHTLRLKVFDVHNNFSEAETDFIVAESADIALKRVLNYPNPFTTYTEFQFEHNRVGQPLEVQVQIFTVSGKLVKTINQLVVPEGNRVTGIAWNGLDDYGDKIGKGVYVYRVKVRSQLDNSTADKYEKLVILR